MICPTEHNGSRFEPTSTTSSPSRRPRRFARRTSAAPTFALPASRRPTFISSICVTRAIAASRRNTFAGAARSWRTGRCRSSGLPRPVAGGRRLPFAFAAAIFLWKSGHSFDSLVCEMLTGTPEEYRRRIQRYARRSNGRRDRDRRAGRDEFLYGKADARCAQANRRAARSGVWRN